MASGTMDMHSPGYLVARSVYSRPSYQEENEKKEIVPKTFKEKLQKNCSCTPRRAYLMVKSFIPFLEWIPKYRWKEWVVNDIIAGLSVGLVCTLQGLAFAILNSVPPVYGLYSSFFPILPYFFLGTSRHISVGPFPVTSLMMGSLILELAPDSNFIIAGNSTGLNTTVLDTVAMNSARVMISSTLCFLIGLIQLFLGIFQIGFIIRYLGDSIVGGFTTAAAFQVFVSQVKSWLNVPTKNYNGVLSIIYTIIDIFKNIGKTNICDLIAGCLSFIVIVVVKEINDRYKHILRYPIPIEILVTIVATGISYGANLAQKYNAGIVKTIPSGFIPPIAPDSSYFSSMGSTAFSVGIVGYAVAVSVGKVYGTKHNYPIDGNQEFIAFGVANMFGGIFSSFIATTALSRTAIQESVGGKTQIAGLTSAFVVFIAIVALGRLLEPLQKSVLAAIVVANLKGMFWQVADIPRLWRQNKWDSVTWVFTCAAAIILGLDLGLYAGLIFGILTIVLQVQFPSCGELGNVPGTEIYQEVKVYKNVVTPDGIKIVRFNSGLFYGNTEGLRAHIKKIVGFDLVKVFTKRSKALRKIHKLIKKGQLRTNKDGVVTDMGVDNEAFESEDEIEDPENENEEKQEVKEVEIKVDWNSELPAIVLVPKVSIHSLILDFGQVTFLDVVGVKAIRLLYKEFKRIDVDLYIAACADHVYHRFTVCPFFDDQVKPDMFFLTIHDAVLYIEDNRKYNDGHDPLMEKISLMQESKEPLEYTAFEPINQGLDPQDEAILRLAS